MNENETEKSPELSDNTVGEEMYNFIETLFPLCRSITGDGVRKTLNIIKDVIPLQIIEVPSETQIFDWSIPKEWNIRDAYVKDSTGKKIIDFAKSNLHVLNYSVPVNKKVSLSELKEHLFSIPKHPDWILYITSYYKENWGFSIPHNQLKELKEDTYEVVIDTTLENGHLTYGEYVIEGESRDEVLLSTYICHPSMCNDNLSGTTLLVKLAESLRNKKLRYTYRFLFIPETIGALTWLSRNQKIIHNIKHGIVATCVGDRGISTYKRSRQGKNIIDQAVEKALEDSKEPYKIIDFFPNGSDERQFCSPGFNLPVGSLMRTMYGRFPEYHTSADNLDFVHPEALANSFKKYLDVIYILENNRVYVNLQPMGEPQLGKRGLYPLIGAGKGDGFPDLEEIKWVLNLSDGTNSLLDISIRSKIGFRRIKKAADTLFTKDLLRLIQEKM
jgi:aminopeptidase-like protein